MQIYEGQEMKLVTFYDKNKLKVGALKGNVIVDLTRAHIAKTMMDLIAGGKDMLKEVRIAIKNPKSPCGGGFDSHYGPARPGRHFDPAAKLVAQPCRSSGFSRWKG